MYNTFLEMCVKVKAEKCYEVVPIPNSQKYYKTHSYSINALVLYAKRYTLFNISKKYIQYETLTVEINFLNIQIRHITTYCTLYTI